MRRAHHRGLSLMEVILATAILGGALATIGQLIQLGARRAAAARDLTMAQLYAESEMNRLSSGIDVLDTVKDEKYDTEGLYNYSVDAMTASLTGLMEVTVTMKQAPGTAIHPVSYSLTRWIVDPTYAQELADQEAAMKQAFADAQAANTNAQASGTTTAGAPAAGGASSTAAAVAGGGAGAAIANQQTKGGNQQGKGAQGKGGQQQGKGGGQPQGKGGGQPQ